MSRRYFSLVLLVLMFLFPGLSAMAHAEFATSDPADGSTVSDVVDSVTIRFTGAVEPIGDGFTAMDSTGALTVVTTSPVEGGAEWEVGLDRAPVGDTVIRWEVKAPDAHPFSGAIRFTAPGPTAAVGPGIVTDQALAEFASTDEAGTPLLAAIGRVLSVGGVMLSVGSLIFAAVVVRGHPSSVAHVMYWVRRTALLVPLGAVLELGSQVAREGAVAAVVFSSYGLAVLLRLFGGAMLFAAAPLAGPPVPSVSLDGTRVLVAAGDVAGHGAGQPPCDPARRDLTSGRVSADKQYTGIAASVMMLAAFLFDGHTVTEGSRIMTGVFDVVHVLAGATWVGGVAMLAAVLFRFRSRIEPVMQALFVLRFSAVAAVAVVGVAIGGVVLAVTILDGLSELWSTPWGLALLVKTGFAAIAGACGVYNHRILLPDLERGFAPQATLDQIRAVVAIEVTALVLLLIATGWLVGAAS